MFNIFVLAFLAVAFALVLSVFITRQKAPGQAQLVPPEEDFEKDTELKGIHLADLYVLAEHLCRENQLTIKQKFPNSEKESYWVGESQNEFFFGNYVLGFLETDDQHPFVTLTDVLEFKDFIKSAGGSKGFFFTTGYFTRDVHQPLEGPKVALYNKRKVLEELKRFRLPS